MSILNPEHKTYFLKVYETKDHKDGNTFFYPTIQRRNVDLMKFEAMGKYCLAWSEDNEEGEHSK